MKPIFLSKEFLTEMNVCVRAKREKLYSSISNKCYVWTCWSGSTRFWLLEKAGLCLYAKGGKKRKLEILRENKFVLVEYLQQWYIGSYSAHTFSLFGLDLLCVIWNVDKLHILGMKTLFFTKLWKMFLERLILEFKSW